MKKLIVSLFVGLTLGAAVMGLVSPSLIAWYFDPPASIGVSCKDAVTWGISAYQKIVLIGGLVGLLISAIFVALSRNKKA